jgi:hypothetical protein
MSRHGDPCDDVPWVAGPDSARDGAAALLASVLRRRRLWAAALVIAGSMALVLWGSGTDSGAALTWGLAWAVVVMGTILTLSYVATRRRFARQLPAGMALESAFEADVVVLRAPHTESRVAFAGIDRARRSGDWVLLRQRRSRVISCWPAALFPADELARLQHAISPPR